MEGTGREKAPTTRNKYMVTALYIAQLHEADDGTSFTRLISASYSCRQSRITLVYVCVQR